jgi:hypothetical protein
VSKIRHGGNPDLVLDVVQECPDPYGHGTIVLAKGNGLWYVGVASSADGNRLLSPNGYGYEGDAREYFKRETKR